MKKFLLHLFTNALSIYATSFIVNNMIIGSLQNLIAITILLSFANFFIKPIIKFLTLPITFLSLGLFSFIINATILKFVFFFVEGAELTGIIPSIVAATVIAIINCLLSSIVE